MRSRNISASTIIQNMAQIKELYKDSWETIPGNSDTILYLGGNEASTHKYISEALGKATIDTRTHGQTKGRSGSYSTNFQMSGRELLTPDEVRGLDNRYAILEYGSAFHWPEHYVLIQGTEGAIRLDMFNCGGTLKKGDKEEHFLMHKTQEEDDDRTRIYHGTEMDGAIMYGKPGKKPPMWLHSIMYDEMQYFNGIMHGAQPDEEFKPLLTGEAARNAIATADACTRSRFEDRKVKLSEIMGIQGGNKDEA